MATWVKPIPSASKVRCDLDMGKHRHFLPSNPLPHILLHVHAEYATTVYGVRAQTPGAETTARQILFNANRRLPAPILVPVWPRPLLKNRLQWVFTDSALGANKLLPASDCRAPYDLLSPGELLDSGKCLGFDGLGSDGPGEAC